MFNFKVFLLLSYTFLEILSIVQNFLRSYKYKIILVMLFFFVLLSVLIFE